MNKFNKTLLALVLLGTIAPATISLAEDIDIYARPASETGAANPNVLIVIDNSANWAAANQGWPDGIKQGQAELRAVRTVASELNDKVNLGLMMFTEGSGSNKNGGYVRFKVRKMNQTNKSAFAEMIGDASGCTDGPNSLNGTPNCIFKNFNNPAEKTNTASTDYSAVLYEVFKYFGGYTSPAHATDDVAGSPVDASHFGPLRYAGNPDAKSDRYAYTPDTDTNRTTYKPPIKSDGSCAKNYVIFIGNGFPAQDSPASLLSGVGGDTTQLSLNTPTNKARYADEWARFLNKTDVNSAPGQQKVTTFTIDVYKDQQDSDQTALLISMAKAGGGKYFAATNEQAIMTALRKIISEIQSANSVFASSSLPVSVNTQGAYLNQVFMGMFRPEGSAAPRWVGNLKQYEFKIFNGVLRLADKNGNEAISSTTGFVTSCAASFWSSDTGNYWNYPGSQAIGNCTAITSAFPTAGSSSIFSDLPDGEVVEKGGAAQHLRGVLSSGGTLTSSSQNYAVCTGAQTPETAQCRKLMTCDGSSATSCTSLTGFDVSNTAITATNLNIPVAAQRDNLINWIRGKDVDNENENFDAGLNPITDEMRPSAHGGVVHSQPGVVDYGGSIGVVAFYGADDGVFHAVRGNQLDTDGTELWGFIAPETYGRFHRLRVNTPLISFPADPVSARPAGTERKDYFFDGSIGVYQKSGTAWIYTGMRRGGRAIYAFDVSDPANPTLKWRKGCFTNDTANNTSCSTDVNFPTAWSGIGQTWSKPTLGHLDGYKFPAGYAVAELAGKSKPVLIFGGGYDSCEDNDSPTPCTGARKGAQVWFVDADTGAIIRTYPISASVPGDISLLTNSGGFVTHVYVSDTNGGIYRINVGTFNGTTLTASSSNASFVAAGWSSNASYSAIEIAQLSEANHARKFISGPNVVPYAGYNAVLIGSGDREHPLVDSYACNNFSTAVPGTFVTNQFYMIKDRPNAYPATPITPGDLTDVTSGTTTPFTEASISAYGWRFDFGPCEQSVNRPLTVAGITYFGTNTPTPTAGSSCFANLGIAKGYAVDFTTGNAATGNARSALFLGGGMPPSPVAGVVDVDGTKLPFIIGGVDTTEASTSALQGSKVEINPTGERYRVFWYIQND